MLFAFPRARARGPPLGRRFRSGRRRLGAMGLFGASRSKPLAEGFAVACVRSGISGWVIGLLIRGRAGAERARRILVAGAGRQRGPPPFSVLDLEIGGGGGDRRSQLLAGGRRSDIAFG